MTTYPPGFVRDGMPAVSDQDLVRRQTMLDKLDNARDTLESACTNWDTLTAAQKDAALKLTIRVVCGLSRLAIHRYDSAGP
jgi:hypothetical protein